MEFSRGDLNDVLMVGVCGGGRNAGSNVDMPSRPNSDSPQRRRPDAEVMHMVVTRFEGCQGWIVRSGHRTDVTERMECFTGRWPPVLDAHSEVDAVRLAIHAVVLCERL